MKCLECTGHTWITLSSFFFGVQLTPCSESSVSVIAFGILTHVFPTSHTSKISSNAEYQVYLVNVFLLHLLTFLHIHSSTAQTQSSTVGCLAILLEWLRYLLKGTVSEVVDEVKSLASSILPTQI